MKTKLFTLILGLITISTFGQKKEMYLNDDLVEITQTDFKKADVPYKFYNLRFELDSLFANVKVQRIRKGKITNELLDSIKSELLTISGDSIPKNNFIIINYYHGLDRCNSSGDKSYVRAKYKRFLKKINKTKNISQFFMYKSPEGTKEYGKQLNWIKDEFGTIEKIFLPLHYPCGSYVLINSDGNYYVQKGEYNIERIIDLLKNKKTFANNVYN
tara:strand:+ start:4754 stop:5398 length:645 start_codon:yes stop_codon:yes gene_type:complete